MVDWTCAFLTVVSTANARQGNERSRATKIESLPLLFFMQLVDTASANHHAHDFSSLPLYIDTKLVASKAPKSRRINPGTPRLRN